MQSYERFIVPGLGVVILLSALMMGAPLMYLLLLGLLGLAAVGTLYVPHEVQVELRMGIAALGVIFLIFYFSSLGFWLALLSFGAIGGMQIRHRDVLQNPPHTIAWLNGVLARRGAGGADADGSTGEGAGAPAIVLPAKLSGLQGRVSIAGIVAAVLGVIILLTTFMQWYSISYRDETLSFSGWEIASGIAEDMNTSLPYVFFWTITALGVVILPSVVLPRVVPIIVGVAGLAVTIVTMVYIVQATDADTAREAGVALSFGAGAYVSALAFIVVAALHVIPATYKRLGVADAND